MEIAGGICPGRVAGQEGKLIASAIVIQSYAKEFEISSIVTWALLSVIFFLSYKKNLLL